MSRDLGSSRTTRSAADASMLTEIRRRAVASQNYAAQQFLKPLFSRPAATSLASGNAALFTQNRIGNPSYSGSASSIEDLSGGGGGGVDPGTAVGTTGVAIAFGDTSFGDVVGAGLDESGNIYAAIYGGTASTNFPINQYTGTIGGIAGQSLWGTLASSNYTGNNNTTLVKYTSAGVPVWATCITATTQAIPLDCDVDPSGNLYVYFYASGTSVTFRSYSSGGGSGSSITLTTSAISGATNGSDVFLCKYNTSGQFQWCVTVTSTGATNETPFQGGLALAIDYLGNSYTVFSTANNLPTLTFKSFGSLSGTTVVYTTFGQDALSEGYRSFVVKVNSSGAIQWVSRMRRQNPATGTHNITGVGTNASGTLVATALYANSSPGVAVDNFSNVSGGVIQYSGSNAIAASTSSIESYVAAFTESGAASWVTRLASAGGNTIAYATDIDGDQNTYVGGSYTQNLSLTSAVSVGGGTISVTPYATLSRVGGNNSFLVKYNVSGVCTAATSISATSGTNQIYGIALDVSSNVYTNVWVSPTTANSVGVNNFASTTGGVVTTSLYGTTQAVKLTDGLLIKYNPSLAVQWVTRAESGSGAGSGDDVPRAVAAHPTSNYVVTAGYFSNLSVVPLTIYSASGVSGGVIQYTQTATLSTNRTAAGSGRSGYLITYT